MMSNEFTLIEQLIKNLPPLADDELGPGDDAAIVSVPEGHQLAVSVDTLIEGVHFPVSTCAKDVAYKALAVNLSDLAAMGADPKWVTLSLSLPLDREAWIQAFIQGLQQSLQALQVHLIGGDLTRSPNLSITIQAQGLLPQGSGLKRSNAQLGDLIYVSGCLGDAGLALMHWQGEINLNKTEQQAVLPRLNRPIPRVELGRAIRDIAHAAIDISDGLAQDLQHILLESQVGARLNLSALPLSSTLKHRLGQEQAWRLALTAGDDYELCFCVSSSQRLDLENMQQSSPELACYYIGEIIEPPYFYGETDQKNSIDLHDFQGFQHFC